MKSSQSQAANAGSIVNATCGICGDQYELSTDVSSREGHLCESCGASGRSQAIAYCLSKYVFQKDKALSKLRPKKKIRIVGLSDGPAYAPILAEKCDYTNTFYHREPYLDITKPPSIYQNAFDALISADVFEHVLAAPSHAFQGAYDVLKEGGHLILTVPFINIDDHREHYPGLVNYSAEEKEDGSWKVHLEFPGGRTEVDETPCFHGGPGKTLEVRLFSRKRIQEELAWAGFKNVIIHDENMPERGINWNQFSRIIVAQK